MSRPPKQKRSRTVPAVYGATSLVLMLVIATLALVLSPPGPPALAEFAPRAEEPIEEAPEQQSSSFGTGPGDGDCAAGQACEERGQGLGGVRTRSTAVLPQDEEEEEPELDDDIVVRRPCGHIGDPPRQTEDPQSPPCISYWKGDNGGATAKGVTRDEIRVAIRNELTRDFEAHFNKRYMFYGRTLRFISSWDRDELISARMADEEADAFAMVLAPYHSAIDHTPFQRELARRGIVSVNPGPGYGTGDFFRSQAPYAWSFGPTFDEVGTNLGRFVCRSLGTNPATWAGGDLQLKARKYAVLYDKAKGNHPDLSALHRELRRCHIDPPPSYAITDEANQLHVTLVADGITTVLVLSSDNNTSRSTLGWPETYAPEWVIGGIETHDNEAWWMTLFKPTYRKSMFGVWHFNKLLPREDTPSWWAYSEFHPEAQEPQNRNKPLRPDSNAVYRALLLLASGIQGAGPRLTPETFAAGLRKTTFPNPGAGTAPYYQAHVGFGPGDYAMTEGAAVVWWNDSAPSYGGSGLSNVGGWCYVDKGTRFTAATPVWPDVSGKLFDKNPLNCR